MLHLGPEERRRVAGGSDLREDHCDVGRLGAWRKSGPLRVLRGRGFAPKMKRFSSLYGQYDAGAASKGTFHFTAPVRPFSPFVVGNKSFFSSPPHHVALQIQSVASESHRECWVFTRFAHN